MNAYRFSSFIKKCSMQCMGLIHRKSSLIGLMVIALLVSGFTYTNDVFGKGGRANQHWVGTWSTSPAGEGPSFNNQTLRQIVHITIGGDSLRVRFCNSFGIEDLTIDAASIGIQDEDEDEDAGAAVAPGSLRPLTFNGASSVVISAGASIFSDPVTLYVVDEADLAISAYFSSDTGVSTIHPGAFQTSYIASGDQTNIINLNFDEMKARWYWLSGVEVLAHRNTHAVVTFGDSFTDGNGSTVDANARYPDWLARRLLDRYPGKKRVAVLNAGIGGNRLLNDGNGSGWVLGVSALARLDRDVLAQSGATHVILLEGLNDIGFSDVPPWSPLPEDFRVSVTTEEIIAGYEQIVERIHEAGLKIIIGTLIPYKDAPYWSPDGEIKRDTVNEWIRTSNMHDGCIDFAEAVCNPDDPQSLHPDYIAPDNTHLNDSGYEAMADAVNLKLLRAK